MQTTARVLVRAAVLLAILVTYGLATSRIQGADAAQADIGGGLIMFGLAMLVAAVWAGIDARRSTTSGTMTSRALSWAVVGVVVAIALDVTMLVRDGVQPLVDLVVLGGFVAVVLALPAILAAVLVPPAAPATRAAAR